MAPATRNEGGFLRGSRAGGAPAEIRLPLIDMLAGAGGASPGFMREDFAVAAALEVDGRRCSVYERMLG